MKLAIVTAHAGATSLGKAMISWGGVIPTFVEDGSDGPLAAWNRGLQASWDYDIIAVMHDDVLIHDKDWSGRVIDEFERDPKVGLIGFGGSKTWGVREIYRVPYQIMQLSRGLYMSNMTDAESHGVRYQGSPIDIAVLDGFAMIFRRSFIDRVGRFPVNDLKFHGYDFWACGIAARNRWKIRLVPVSCTHIGGQTSVSQKMDDGMNHAKGHEYIYKTFADVLPVAV